MIELKYILMSFIEGEGHDAFAISPGVISFASDVLYTNYTFNLNRVSHPEPVRKFLFYLTMGILI